MDSPLRIVVVASDVPADDPPPTDTADAEARSRALRVGLLEGGCNLVAVLPPDAFLDERITQWQPDLIMVDAESDARDALEHVVLATRDAPRPIVLYTNDDRREPMRAAVAAGVSAYVVAGLAAERVRPVLDVALARFEVEQRLRAELADARSALRERKLIERAKALLIEQHGLSEPQAYARMRRAAMDRKLRLVDVAQRILDVSDLLRG